MAGFGLNPLDAAIGDAETTYGLSPGLVNPTSRVAAPGLDPTDQQVATLNAKEPGTYAAMTPEEFEGFKQKQAASSPGQTRPFSAGVEAGLIGNGTMAGNFAQALGVKFSNQTLYDAGKTVQDASARGTKGLEPRVGSVADVHSFSDAWDYIKYSTGNAIGSSAPSLVTGVLATFVTENPILGMAAGAAAPSYIQNTGDMYGTLRDSPGIAEQVKAGKLTPEKIVDYSMMAGVPLAALDIMGEVETLGLSKVLGGAIDKATVGRLKQSIIGRVTNAIARGAVAEGSTEGMQQVIQESVSEVLGDKTPASQRVINVLDNAIGGALGGGAMGGGAHAVQAVAGRGQQTPAPAPAQNPNAPLDSGAAASPQPQRPAVDPANGATRVYVDTPAETVPAPSTTAPATSANSAQVAPAAPGAMPSATPAAPPAGPLGRAMERGKASETAAAAEAMVPVGTPVAVSMPGVPALNVTVQGYHADGMDVVDDSGEVHTLPMNDPDVTVTPLGGTAPLTASDPHPEPLPEGAEAAPAIGVPNLAQDVGEGGTLDTARVEPSAAEPVPEAIEPGLEPETVPAVSPVEGGIREAAAAAAPKSRPAPEGEREAKPVPFSFDVAGKKVAFPSDGLASLYDVGQRRNSFRQGGRDTSGADKLIETERQRTADLLGIPLEDVNKASDEYRHIVEQAAKSGKDAAQVAPAFDPKTLTAARDAWDGMEPAARKVMLDRAGVKRSPKMKWDALGVTIQNKIRPAMNGPTLEEAAHEAATSPQNDRNEPTQAQKEAGNYKLGHHAIGGLDLSIENPEGSERKGVDPKGKPWSVKMKSHYGYIKGTVGFDKDHVDAFVKAGTPNDWNGTVYVVDQNKANGHFDEHKVMIGFDSEAEARKAYSANYAKDWEGLAAVTAMPIDEFKSWVKSDQPKKGAIAKAAAPEQPAAPKADGKPVSTFPAVGPKSKWFSTRERSQTYMDKKGLTASHEIVQTQRQRFEIRPKAAEQSAENAQKSADARRLELLGKEALSPAEAKELREVNRAAEEHPGLVVKSLQTGKETVIQPKGTKPPADKPVYGASNKLVSADRAAEVRAKLKAKLKGQLNSGIDPEVLALGAELAAFHLEAGARKFADVARAVAKDLDTDVSTIRKYLRAWYNGARDMLEDSGFDIVGMDTPETVRAQVAMLSDAKEEPDGGLPKLDQASSSALEGAPSEAVSPTGSEREAGSGSERGGGADVSGVGGARGGGARPAGRVGDGAGELPVPARAGQPVRDDKARQPDVEGQRAGDGDRNASRRDEKRGAGDSDSAAKRIESQVKKDAAPPETAATPAPQISGNFVIGDEDAIGEGSQRQKVQQNLEAIRLLKQLGDRKATRAEQAILAKYVGWGGLKAAFPREDGSFSKGWDKIGAELRDLLGPEEYKASASSTQNAHYTAPEIVKAMWDAVRRLGFGGGRVLEPSVGVGNFFGLMPGEMREHSQLTGVEKDWVTGGIAKHLYPDANIQDRTGFEQFVTPDGYFDLAIGNPPFGSERVFDVNRKNLKFSIHNFFFAKSLDSLRPGGLLAMVVSDSLMDSRRDGARRYLSERADLVGAVRLPNNAFEKNAGTSVTTDIIFLRKRADGEAAAGDPWVDTATFTDTEDREMPLNEYFKDHPENVLGKLGWYGTMRPEGHSAVVAPEGQDTAARVRDFIASLPERPIEAPGVRLADPTIEAPQEAGAAVVGSMFMDKDGKVWMRGQDLLGKPQAEPASIEEGRVLERVKGLIGIRDAFAKLRKAQLHPEAGAGALAGLRAKLNKTYDSFVAENGPINLDANRRVFQDDPTWPQLSALEDKFDKGISSTVAAKTGEKPRAPSAQKAAVFSKRTQHPYQAPTSAPSAKDALAISQNELGKIDLDYMARLYGKSPEAIVQELGPLVFKNPEAGWQAREDYLSGNVKRKLALAVESAKADPSYQRNVDALKEVIPADLNPIDIRVAPGAHWVPPKYVEEFAAHITETDGAKAFYSPQIAKWILSKVNSTPASEAKWGTQRTSVTATLEAAINGRTITVSDRHSDGSSSVNHVATEAANEKVARVRDEWKRWLWQDDARRDALAGLYNDTFNTDQPWEPDGSHLSLPGTIDVIELRPHQKNFIWRVIQKGVALADHVVGAGKTFAVIGSIMEMRRLGLAKKPMLVVPNHLVEQWGADFMRLYPGANILAATKKDFDANNRRRLFARIATGDYDAVIVAHSSFGKIPVDLDYQRKFIESQVDDMEASISALREAEGKKTRNVAQMEKARDSLTAKLKRLLDGPSKDEIGLTFQDIGIDALAVDEAHEFKNLAFSSSMQRVAGLGNQKGSQKASDIYMKTQSVLDKTGGRNIIFATGTPISNTMAEMFTVQRYLDGRRLRDLGLAHFDAWARQFGEIVSDWELSPSGKYKMNSRFAKFVNVPELLRQYKGFADVITRDDIERQLAAQGKTLGIPKMVGGKPQNVIVDRTEFQADYIGVPIKDRSGADTENYPEGSLIHRAEHLPKGPPKKGDDNMLKIMSDARKAALDMRLIDANYPDPDAGKNKPVSKVGTAAVSIKRIYDQWHADKGAQLVFIDLSTPKKAREKEGARIRDLMKKAEEGDEDAQHKLDAMSPDEFDALTSEFSVYDDLRAKLLKLGIPDKEIAFIHDANTDKQKAELFGRVRSGDIRVLLGSTAKMGAGMNVQERLVALHHIDAPWRPSDLEQREGRIIRQGNSLYARDPENFEVGVYRYATKNTLDARMWQTIEGKARFIEQLRKGDLSAREIEDVAGEASNAAEMKAAASGNPLILEEMDLRQKVRKLDAARSQHDREQFDIKRSIKFEGETAAANESSLPRLRQDAETVAAMGEKPTMKVGTAEYEKPKEFGDAILVRAAKMIAKDEDQADLGQIGGFPLTISNLGVVYISDKNNKEYGFVIEIGASEPEEVKIGDPKVADATGVAMKLLNTVRKLPERVAKAEQALDYSKSNVEKLRALVQPWDGAEKLQAAEERHRAVIDQLKPKKKDQAPRLTARADVEIAENGGRFNVVNKDGQRFANQPADGFHTRVAAEDWITDQIEANKTENRPGFSEGEGDEQSSFVDLGQFPRREGQPIGHQAQQAVLERGRATGIEHLVALDKDGNAMVWGRGIRNNIQPPERLLSAALDPNAEIVIHHNHPLNSALSGGDIAMFAFPGVASVWAHGHDGAVYRASPTPEAKKALASADPYAKFQQVRSIIADDVDPILWGGFIKNRELAALPRKELGELFSHFRLAALQRAGLIDVESNFQDEAEIVRRLGMRQYIDQAARKLRSKVLNGRQITDNDGRPGAVRYAGDVGATFEENGSPAGSDPKQTIAGEDGEVVGGDKARRERPGFSESGLGDPNRAMPRTPGELSDAVKALAEDQRDKALALLPLNVLPDWAAPNQVAVQQYIDTKRSMDTYRNKKQNIADEIVQRWRKAVGKGGADAKPLADVMHEATLLGFDPARPSDGWEHNRDQAALMKRYRALTPNAQAVYEEVRDAYVDEAEERDKIILENVSKAMDQELRTAERTRDRELAEIRDEGLTGDEKKDAVKAAEDKFTRAQQKLKFGKKARLAALRAAFESNRVPSPYFPLARFGQYFVAVRDDLGKIVSFSRVETKAQLDRVVRDLRAQLPHGNIETGLLEDKGNLRSQMDPRVLADIQAILGNAGVSDDVMDQVWQRYLEAMPDLSIRKRSIHRGGVAGFNTDAMRAFASHMFHSAHQIGRVKFGGDMLELVNQAVDQAKQAKDPISAMKVANELSKRHEWVMNPKGSAWANNATTLGFLYFLGFSPASAAVNLTQTAIMGVPILGSRFGMGNATAALTKASHDFVSGKGGVETSGKLTDLEKTAIADLYERGTLDKSMSHDLAGIADRGAGYNPTRQRVMQAMSFLFHHAERFNREVTALAAYRLARQAGMSHGAAVDKAGELTWLTHFDYSNTNRPRVMQNDAAKVILLFKNFQINSMYRLFRDTQQAFAGDTPQARKEARFQLTGIVGMYALMAGGLGVPLLKYTLIPLWKLMFGTDDDKSDEEEFRGAVLNTLGPQLGGMALDGVPGYLTGTSLTKRIGMGDLWFQSQDRVQTAQDWWNSLANEMLGPVWGMGHNIYNGFNVIRDGKGVARGVEMMMPTAAKNLMKAWRYSQEGVVNMRGDIVVSPESLGLKDALKQAIGFTPAAVAEQYTRNDEKANMDKRIGQQRKQLLDGYAKAHKAGDEAATASALAEIQKFNAEPTHAAKRITGETIRDSIRTRNRLSNRAENGIIIQNRRQNTLLNERLPPRVY